MTEIVGKEKGKKSGKKKKPQFYRRPVVTKYGRGKGGGDRSILKAMFPRREDKKGWIGRGRKQQKQYSPREGKKGNLVRRGENTEGLGGKSKIWYRRGNQTDGVTGH